uniref:DUF4282 domain-containing protein n=1 Tax=Acidihalobacter prosperus TaxID=160660 RepID=UPI000505C616|nr:DUF4282 domain-containing protein [Acidihalobacter prosperus]
MRDIFFFDKMLIPRIITGIYWITLLAVLIGGLASMFDGYGGFTAGKFFEGVFYMVAGAIAARIWCELLIVLFKINEALQEIRHK